MARARTTTVELAGTVRINRETAASNSAKAVASSEATMRSGKAISVSSLTGQTTTNKGTTLRATSTSNVDRTRGHLSSRTWIGKRSSSVDLKATKEEAEVDSTSVHSRVRTRAIIQVTNSNIKTLDIKVEEEVEVDSKVDKVEEEATQAVRRMLWCQLQKTHIL